MTEPKQITLTEVQFSKVVESSKDGKLVFTANRFAQIIGINPSTFRSMLQRSSNEHHVAALGRGIEAKREEKVWSVYVPMNALPDREPFFPTMLCGFDSKEDISAISTEA